MTFIKSSGYGLEQFIAKFEIYDLIKEEFCGEFENLIEISRDRFQTALMGFASF